MTQLTYVHYHDCPMFGPNTKVPRALLASKDGQYVLYHQHKCLCGYTAGEKKLARGVTENEDGSYTVDTAIAERLTQ